jgi:hypothetical protein
MSSEFDNADGITIDRHAAEWGLASSILGGVFVIIAPIVLMLNAWLWSSGWDHLRGRERDWIRVGVVVGLCFVAFVCVLAVVFGLIGLSSARLRSQPKALPLAGIILGVFSCLIWTIVGIDLLAIVRFFR